MTGDQGWEGEFSSIYFCVCAPDNVYWIIHLKRSGALPRDHEKILNTL